MEDEALKRTYYINVASLLEYKMNISRALLLRLRAPEQRLTRHVCRHLLQLLPLAQLVDRARRRAGDRDEHTR